MQDCYRHRTVIHQTCASQKGHCGQSSVVTPGPSPLANTSTLDQMYRSTVTSAAPQSSHQDEVRQMLPPWSRSSSGGVIDAESEAAIFLLSLPGHTTPQVGYWKESPTRISGPSSILRFATPWRRGEHRREDYLRELELSVSMERLITVVQPQAQSACAIMY